MDQVMTRRDFQELAELRLDEAKVLLEHGKPDGSYHLAGYAVECALKACIAKKTREHDWPPKDTKEYYTHKIDTLVKTATLVQQRKVDSDSNPQLEAFWATVREWDETSRYDRKTITEASVLIEAISHEVNGVLPWINRFW